jgi:hypothetical protein
MSFKQRKRNAKKNSILISNNVEASTTINL